MSSLGRPLNSSQSCLEGAAAYDRKIARLGVGPIKRSTRPCDAQLFRRRRLPGGQNDEFGQSPPADSPLGMMQALSFGRTRIGDGPEGDSDDL
jgi:hypothetical protein